MTDPVPATDDAPAGPPPLALLTGMALVTRYRLRLAHPSDARLGDLGEGWELAAAGWTGTRSAFAGFFTPDAADPAAGLARRVDAALAWGVSRLATQPADRCDILLVALGTVTERLTPSPADPRVHITVISADPATGEVTELCSGAGGLPGAREIRAFDRSLRSGTQPPTLAAVDLAEREAVRGGYLQPARSALAGTPAVTYALIGSWILIWLIEHVVVQQPALGQTSPQVGYDDFGTLFVGVPGLPFSWWQIVGAGFVHLFNTPFHLAVNSWAMFQLGRNVEHLYGRLVALAAFVVCVCGSSLFIWLLYTTGIVTTTSVSTAAGTVSAPGVSVVGASGGIMGLLGMMLTMGRTQGKNVPAGLVAALRNNALMNAAFVMIYSVVLSGISWEGHLGGLIAGALLALVVPPMREIGGRDLRLYEKGILVAIIGFGAVSLGAVAVHVVAVAGGSAQSLGGY